MRKKKDINRFNKMLLMIIVILLILMLSIIVVKEYVHHSTNNNVVKYENSKEKLNSFQPNKNISKLSIDKDIKKEIHIESNKIVKTDKEKIYETILSEYKSLFNNYIEHIKICKKMDIKYKNTRESKDLNKRVILKQNKNLLDCYETVELTSEELESITEDLAKNYSKRIKQDTKSMIKIFSENKNMVKKNLINLRTKIN